MVFDEKWASPTFLHIRKHVESTKEHKGMKSEFALAFNEIIERSALSKDMVVEALQAAMVSAYRRAVSVSSAQLVEARIDLENGTIAIFTEKEIVEEIENPLTEATLTEACEEVAEAELGDMVLVDSTPEDFGRVAAQTAKQVILQRLREAERDVQYHEYVEREGDMVHGTVHSITTQAVTIGLGRAEAILPRNQMIPGERFRVRDRVRVYVLEVRKSSRGPVIIVSRTHPHMLRRLLEMEVPEINQGLVEIKAIAREAGKRAKVAVAALRDGVDPVGACVGLRGVRIQSIVRDLNDEKIDVIEWHPDEATFISKALSPARVSGVFLDENPARGKTAMVVVPEDQLSLAIGRSGVNARLAARLTNWRIDIKSLPEAAIESLQLFQTHAAFKDIKEPETVEQIGEILDKKAENRPISPEEYKVLTSFVNRIQRDIESDRNVQREAARERLQVARAEVPAAAYEILLADVEKLPERVLSLLVKAEYENAGKVLEDMLFDENLILGLDGVGPKAMADLRAYLDHLKETLVEIPEPEPEAPVEPDVSEEDQIETEDVDALVEETTADAADIEKAAADPVDEVEAVEEVADETGLETEIEEEKPGEEFDPDLFEKVLDDQGTEFTPVLDDDDEEEFGDKKEIISSKKKKRGRRVVYDPELDKTFVERHRKPGREGDWEDFDNSDF